MPACVSLTLWYNTIDARDAARISHSCGNEVLHYADFLNVFVRLKYCYEILCNC